MFAERSCRSASRAACARMVSAWAMAVALAASAAPAGDTWECDTFGEIRNAMLNANPGDEVLILPGEYHVTSALYVTTPNLTFRGSTGNRDDVVLHGNGMNENSGVLEGFYAAADGVQLMNVTLRDFWHHGIHVCGTPQSTTDGYADNVVISNVKTINCGERHVKGSASSGVASNVLIENLWMEQTEPYVWREGHSVDEYNYIGGIDAMHLDNWTIRDCTAKNIMGAAGSSRAAFFLWNGVSDLMLEGNTVIRCGHAISIGNPSGPSRSHVDPWHAVGGTIRNNAVLRADESIDNWALELDNVKDFNVYNNTIYSENAGYFRALQVYDDPSEGLTTNLVLRNNILRGGCLDLSTGDWEEADVAAMGNIVDNTGGTVLPAWFVDAANGQLHLTEAATAAIDQAATLADVLYDIDGGPRPAAGGGYDYGADEFASPMGDATYDGLVDGADYTAWADHYGQSGGWGEGDFSGDGTVDGADYTAWADHYGYGNDAGSAAPEPAALMLLAAGAAAALRRRHRA